ncbi:MAG: mechanosensitive ion channel domain-containing protein [Nanoarchaeota archaeon]
MAYFDGVIEVLKKEGQVLQVLIIALAIIIVTNIVLKRIKTKMLKRANSKIQISNIKFFFRIIQVVIIFVIVTVGVFYYFGSWTGLGVFAGLITAGLGFALQKPITGIAAWLIIIIKRPFNVGDRIRIGTMRGEVYDITLTHLYLDEIGGDVDTEDYSGRNIIVPNHLLFENNIINYTLVDDFVLGEVPVSVTYESDIIEAKKIIEEATKKYADEFSLKGKREIKLRVFMEASSITIRARFYAHVKTISKVKSDITEEVYNKIKESGKVDIAYPHTHFIMKNSLKATSEKGDENPLGNNKKQ